MHNKYCLVVTDDYSRFTWAFFLTTKDETSEILKNCIKEIENLVDKKVKIIRSDNGTEFKNKVMGDFCREKDSLGKFDGKSDEENKPMIEGNGPKWLFDIDSLNNLMNYVPVTVGTISNDSAGTSEEISQDCIVMPIWKDTSYFDSPTKDVENGELKTADDAQKQVEDSPNNENEEQDKFEDDSNTKDVNAVGQHVNIVSPDVNTVPTTPNTRIHKDHSIDNVIGDVKSYVQIRRMTKPTSEQGFLSDIKLTSIAKALSDSSWVEANAVKDERRIVIRNKARLVAQGHRQEEGIDYEEVFAPVARIEAIRFCLAYASFMGFLVYQMDVRAEILKKFNYTDVKSASTPVDLEKPLVKVGDADDVDVHLYRSMIGSLMYLTASRPDIIYLKGKPTLGLWYSRDSLFELVVYTDSDYVGATQDRKSTIGGCQFFGNRLISWQCKKQTMVATSTTKAEYVVAASCCRQVLWIENQLLDYGYNFINTVINIDNNSTICIIENPVQHSKTKHIEIRHHFIRDCNAKKLIQMVKIHTDYNVADLLTKGFDAGRFQYLVSSIGMLNP
ncbi:putative ribonuclease H-like domain-containing protein [Tanacetum coccineum]|uniref:Ribonuclease H-like domain-containing protein n=1 Tax=Tanacetum coccineum TaxID=301880 RepID=A0ABQ5A9N5_9ASTR